jgi:hypothetical protein
VIGVSFLSGVGYSLAARGLEHYKKSGDARQLIASAVLLTILPESSFGSFSIVVIVNPGVGFGFWH